MRSFRLFGFVSLACVAICASLARAVAYTLALFRVEPMRFAADGWDSGSFLTGRSIDPALRQSMRHEAGVSRRSADRNT